MVYDIFKIGGRFPVFARRSKAFDTEGEPDMEKHTEHKLLHKAIDRISYRYRHEQGVIELQRKEAAIPLHE